jgi:hypothetical protein
MVQEAASGSYAKMALLICLIFSAHARAARGKNKKYDTTPRAYILSGLLVP